MVESRDAIDAGPECAQIPRFESWPSNHSISLVYPFRIIMITIIIQNYMSLLRGIVNIPAEFMHTPRVLSLFK